MVRYNNSLTKYFNVVAKIIDLLTQFTKFSASVAIENYSKNKHSLRHEQLRS